MNFLVIYCSSNGYVFKHKTYTFGEANAIAKNAISKHCKDVAITPLNEEASFSMFVSETLNSLFNSFVTESNNESFYSSFFKNRQTC